MTVTARKPNVCLSGVVLLVLIFPLGSAQIPPQEKADLFEEQNPGKDDPLQTALRYFEEQKLAEALEYAKEAEDGGEKKLETGLLLGKIYLAQASGYERYIGFEGYFRRDLLGEAEEYFRQSLNIDPTSTEARNHLAFTLLLLRNIPAAKDQLEEVLRRDKSNAYAFYLLGELGLLQEKGEESISFFKRSLEAKPDFSNARAGLIRAYIAENKRIEASKELVRLVEAIPDLPDALILAYGIYESEELYSEAYILYNSMLDIVPDRIDFRFQMGSVAYRLNRFKDAEMQLDLVLEQDNNHEGALYYKGCLQIRAGVMEKAALYFKRAAGVGGDFFIGSLNQLHSIALNHFQEGRYKTALDLFDFIIMENPSDTLVLSNKALALSQAGRSDQADQAYEELLELDAWDSSFINNYALHLFGTSRQKRGLAMLERAIEVDGSLDAMENIASYHCYVTGDLDKADLYLTKVLGSAPERTKALVLHELIALTMQSSHD